MYQYYSQRSSIQENDRNRSFGNMFNSTRSDTLQTDQRHSGCLERIQILVQELDRMADAQRVANQEISQLKQELEQAKKSDQTLVVNNGFDSEILEELKLQQQKFNQYKQVKEQQIEELENELLKVHKQYKEEKLMRMDLNQKYEQKQIEVEYLRKELNKYTQDQQDSNDSGILNQLHEDVIELQSENKELRNNNLSYQQKIEELLENQRILEQKLKYSSKEVSFQPSPAKNQNQYSTTEQRTDPIQKYNRTKTMQPMQFTNDQSSNQQTNSNSSYNILQQRLSQVQIGQKNNSENLINQQDTIRKDSLRSKPKPVENIKYSTNKIVQQF
ncbi:unnamed protein product (macronuclear) [Paramecium tetraurelia]|uniref:Uncharacterized protein n=1 Tax=Paramecium tetraurelia TaxID=5888 RepID=A0E4V7_PARTE|nr:uncharacterized protein GSPATT00023500001 [Paramecium tetraurelia]CAK90324.1 unnamed protein product [Paramecium tetraurelia]|eukprot:XP_001457721.1 hypothetical protein (macronuclear) [Paramecium tetraurelia strain d4-2]